MPPVLTMCGVTAPVLCSAPRHLSRTCRRQPGRGEHRQRGFIIMQLRRCGIKLARKKFLLRQSCKLCFCKLMTKRCSMAPLVARIVAMFYAQCGHTTCGSDLWLPGMSEGECGAGAVDQGCRGQEECSALWAWMVVFSKSVVLTLRR